MDNLPLIKTSDRIPFFTAFYSLMSDMRSLGIKGRVEMEWILEGGHKINFSVNLKNKYATKALKKGRYEKNNRTN